MPRECETSCDECATSQSCEDIIEELQELFKGKDNDDE